MRTITFEVEVDDYLPDTLTPSVDNPNLADAPVGRMFLCGDYDGVRATSLRLMQMSTLASKDGTSHRYFIANDLPKEMRVVKVSNPDETYVNVIPEGLIDHDSKPEQPHSADAAPDAVPSSTLHDDHRAIIETVSGLSNVIDLINANVLNLMENVLNLMENQNANRDGMYAKFEEAFKHFKQVHEHHNYENRFFDEAMNRLLTQIKEGSHHAANTANTVGQDILHALPELEDRIKEYIGEPDPAQLSSAGNAPSGDGSNQVLLRALDLLATVIKK